MAQDLPDFLKNYKDKDHIIRERARFIFYLCIFICITVLFLIFIGLITHLVSKGDEPLHITLILPLIAMLLLITCCIGLLIKGYYYLVSHLIPTIVMITVWIIMFIDKSDLLTKTNTIVFLFTAFSMIPLLLGKYRNSIFFFSGVNIIMIFIFAFVIRNNYHLTQAQILDFILDVSVSLTFVAFVGYHVYSINKKALESAESDFKQRIKIEKEYSQSQKRFHDLTELLPLPIYEVNTEGRITYTNQIGFKSFGYSEEDFKKGINVSMLFDEPDTILSHILHLSAGDNIGRKFTAIHKNGDRFPVEIYASRIEEDGNLTGLRGVIIDVSERQKAEDALKASERKFREMTLLLPQTIYESRLDGTLRYINRAGTEMFGYTEEEAIQNLNVMDTILEEDHLRAKESIVEIIKGNTTKGNQYTGKRKDGSTFPMQINSSPIIEHDKIVGFRGIIFDLTNIKKVENELRQSNELFRTLIESLPISITLYDLNGRFIMVNKAFCDDLGLSREDVPGKTIEELGVVIKDSHEEVINKILYEKGFVENFEVSTELKNGRHHTIYVYATFVTINNQKVVLRSNVNVTEKKNLENKLRESEILLRTVVNMVPYSIIITNNLNQYIFANRAFLDRFQLTFDEIRGKTFSDLGLSFEEGSFDNYIREFNEKGSIINSEFNLVDKDQKKICALLSSQSVEIDNAPHVITTMVDITDRKLLEEKLKEYNLKLEDLVKLRTEELVHANEELTATNDELFDKNELINLKNQELSEALELIKSTQLQLIETEKMASLGILTAGVAHEVNNPLNYLMGVYVGLENYFSEFGSSDAEKIKILLNSMNVGIDRISNIVKSLNQFSRNVEGLDETCDIHAIIDNCISMLYNKLKYKAELTKVYTKEQLVIKGNVGRLHQVFVNLLSNSIQAIPVKGNISIKTLKKGDKAIIEIIDNGIGIAKEHLTKLADPFFTTKPPGEGTGLGLSITQTIINEHHASIKFESEINKGTKVILTFPIH